MISVFFFVSFVIGQVRINVENSDWTTANDPCSLEPGSDWRIPSSSEWANVDVSGNWTEWNGAWNSGLNLHAAGYLNNSNGYLNYRGTIGDFWNNIQYNATLGGYLYSYDLGCAVNHYDKVYGFSLPFLKNF